MKIVLTQLGKLEIMPNNVAVKREANRGTEEYVNMDVLCCAICRTDAKMWEQGQRDLVFPRVLGHEMVVEDKNRDRFIVWPGKSCQGCSFCKNGRENLCEDIKITGFHTDGGFQNKVMLPKTSLIPVSKELHPHAACFAEPVACVINAFEKLTFSKGDRILIFGCGTMGLITALYAKQLGLAPLIVEIHQTKIEYVKDFLKASDICCVKETNHGEFELVINACPDYRAFCQGIVKIKKAGQISFFSGISKNENIETNLLNLIHYKEAVISGAYGMTRDHIKKAVPFIKKYEKNLMMLIEQIIPPEKAPEIISKVLSGEFLKYILDFSLDPSNFKINTKPKEKPAGIKLLDLDLPSLCKKTIEDIKPLSKEFYVKAVAKIDNKTKPVGALGRIEELAVRMSMIQGTLSPEIRQKSMFVFAGDHGITEEGVSAYPSEVTHQMVDNFLKGGAAINVLCRHNKIDMKVVDMGVNADFSEHPDLIIKKVAKGTRNFAMENAMDSDQVISAIKNGMSTFLSAYEEHPIDIVGLGEMGIGNTTSASAIICTLTGITPAQAAGRGTGVDDKGLEHKIKVIERVLAFHTINKQNGFDVLEKIGGFEIAGIAGAALAAASKNCAVVLDGVISTAAGLVAYIINPDIQEYLISGHKSVETAQKAALEHMGIKPLIDFNMRLGEGTGAALAIDVTDAACKIMTEMASFDEAKVARQHKT